MKRMNFRLMFSEFIFVLSFISLLLPLAFVVLINTGIINFTQTDFYSFFSYSIIAYISLVFLFLVQLKRKLSISISNLFFANNTRQKKESYPPLLNNENVFRKIFDNANDAIFLWLINESTGEVEKLIDVNKTAADMFGYSSEEIQKMLPSDYSIKGKKFKAPSAFKKLFIEGSTRFETVFRKKNGEGLDVEIDSRCFTLVDKKVVLSIIRDISGRKLMEEALRLTKFCVDNASIGIIRTDENAKIMEANNYIRELLGFSEKELYLKPLYEISPNHSKTFWENRLINLQKNGNDTYETELISKKGNHIPVAMTNTLITYNGKDYSWSFIHDNSEIVKSKIELSHRERLLSEAQKIARFGYFIYDFSTQNWECSEEVNDIFGIDKTYKKSLDNWYALVEPEQYEGLKKYVDEFLNKGMEKFDNEYSIIRQNDSEKRWIHCLGKVEFDRNKNRKYLIATVQDVTDRRISENKIKESLHEKEILLKEIHHRVKNNLQIVSSLLFLQSQQLKNEELVELFKKSQNRVRTMSLIHEKLYQSKDFNKIDFGQYIDSLILALKESFSMNDRKISIDVKTENILLDIDIAVPCGLIVNELITNSIKHAFENNYSGEIAIRAKFENGNYYLIVKDNGIGFPNNIKIEESQTLGLRIVYNLVRQLCGEYKIENDDGAKFTIVFPKMI